MILYVLQLPPTALTVRWFTVKTPSGDTILQHLQFLDLHGTVRFGPSPSARLFTVTSLFFMFAPVFFTNWKSLDFTLLLLRLELGLDILDTEKLGLREREVLVLILGDRSWSRVGVLARGRVNWWSAISDSEKLLVLIRTDSNFFTEPTMSESLPYVDTTRIDGAVQRSSWLLRILRSRDLSELRAFLTELSIRESGYPAFWKHFLSSSSLNLRRSWLLIILLSRKPPE